jgi:hypothetical protein
MCVSSGQARSFSPKALRPYLRAKSTSSPVPSFPSMTKMNRALPRIIRLRADAQLMVSPVNAEAREQDIADRLLVVPQIGLKNNGAIVVCRRHAAFRQDSDRDAAGGRAALAHCFDHPAPAAADNRQSSACQPLADLFSREIGLGFRVHALPADHSDRLTRPFSHCATPGSSAVPSRSSRQGRPAGFLHTAC